MENYIDHMGDTPVYANEYEPAGMPTWCAFALGGIITFLFVYIGIARPAAREMSAMRRQLSTLEQSVWEVAGQKKTASSTNELLGLLNEQREHAIEAKNSLADMRKLHADIIEEANDVQNAMAAASKLGSLKDILVANSEKADDAANVLAVSEDLYHRLATSAGTADQAVQASNDLLSLRTDLIDSASDLSMAKDRLDGLVGLKNDVLDQTNNLADAVETLELTKQLGARYHEATISFDQIRHWMVEIVAMEPMLRRCQKTLEPLTELTKLDRMAPDQVRRIARAMVDDFRVNIASRPAIAADDNITEYDSDAIDSEAIGITSYSNDD